VIYTRREILAGMISLPVVKFLPIRRRIECTLELTPAIANLTSVFTLLKPDGRQDERSAITDTNGTAIVSFRLKGSDPAGIYNGMVDVSVNGERITDSASVVV
jgi:hypothetical protein